MTRLGGTSTAWPVPRPSPPAQFFEFLPIDEAVAVEVQVRKSSPQKLGSFLPTDPSVSVGVVFPQTHHEAARAAETGRSAPAEGCFNLRLVQETIAIGVQPIETVSQEPWQLISLEKGVPVAIPFPDPLAKVAPTTGGTSAPSLSSVRISLLLDQVALGHGDAEGVGVVAGEVTHRQGERPLEVLRRELEEEFARVFVGYCFDSRTRALGGSDIHAWRRLHFKLQRGSLVIPVYGVQAVQMESQIEIALSLPEETRFDFRPQFGVEGCFIVFVFLGLDQ